MHGDNVEQFPIYIDVSMPINKTGGVRLLEVVRPNFVYGISRARYKVHTDAKSSRI
jgi:hypothetical protein